MNYEVYFLDQIDRFSSEFFGKTGQGGFSMDDSSSLSLNTIYLLRNKQFLFHGL